MFSLTPSRLSPCARNRLQCVSSRTLTLGNQYVLSGRNCAALACLGDRVTDIIGAATLRSTSQASQVVRLALFTKQSINYLRVFGSASVRNVICIHLPPCFPICRLPAHSQFYETSLPEPSTCSHGMILRRAFQNSRRPLLPAWLLGQSKAGNCAYLALRERRAVPQLRPGLTEELGRCGAAAALNHLKSA